MCCRTSNKQPRPTRKACVADLDPNDWPTGDFPEPNPYFPRHRPVSKRGLIAGTLCTLAFALVIVGTISINRKLPQWATVAGIVGGSLFLPAGVIWLIGYQRMKRWARTAILPAQVIVSAAGPPPSGALVDVSTSLLGPVGLLAHLLPKPVKRDTIVVEYVVNGRIVSERVHTADRWNSLPAGEFVWICPNAWRGETCLVQWMSPKEFRETPVPEVVRVWLETARQQALSRFD